jgi:hypothetical protein
LRPPLRGNHAGQLTKEGAGGSGNWLSFNGSKNDEYTSRQIKKAGLIKQPNHRFLAALGVALALALITPALAQKAQELEDAAKMMEDGWKQFNDGQRMIVKGVEMNNLVAVQGGARTKWPRGTR